ncbi:hypothetical protein BDQ12DRAFT_611226 [Crucibulum laeve]|uniref:Uncharacterized protein n=1 Tax=Crucibulum laeve TaxID=68775 RepID=A0A5C3LSA5_9AGAR|nr:hypothetical protein BDQ12DRAFT_611226 [Crucibulum laeve]
MLMVYGIVTLSINVSITMMIVTRLFIHRRHLSRLLGSPNASPYTAIITILVESAALVVLCDIFFLISFALNSWTGNIGFQIWIQIQTIGPLLIIFRVGQGSAWSTETGRVSTQTATINFTRETITVQ